jgi:DNA-binding CsgD family transcriptional regulator
VRYSPNLFSDILRHRLTQAATFLPSQTSQYARRRDATHLSDLAHRIYDASVHPEKWNAVVATIAASLGASKGLLFTPFLAPQHGGLVFPVGIDEAALQLWASSYIDKDVWALSAQARGLWRTGAVLRDHEMVPRDEFLASPFYREFLSTIGIGRVCVGVVFEGTPGLPAASLSIFRDAHEPAFDEADARWMSLLVGHVSRGLGLMRRLDSARLQNTSLLGSYDRLEFGVALLNAGLQVLHLNLAAKRVIDRRDGIGIGANKRLESKPGPGRRAGLAEWLAKIGETPIADQGHFLEECRVTRNLGRRQYAVQCAAVLPASPWTAQSEEVRYVVFIIDPAALQLPSAARLVALFGLTQAQAKVAREFSKGGTYEQVARRLRISVETVRSHVKDIYPKTRVNRQADLVRLVLSLAQSAV